MDESLHASMCRDLLSAADSIGVDLRDLRCRYCYAPLRMTGGIFETKPAPSVRSVVYQCTKSCRRGSLLVKKATDAHSPDIMMRDGVRVTTYYD